MRMNLRRIREILELTLRRCDPDLSHNFGTFRGDFGVSVVETNKTQADLLQEALAEVNKAGVGYDELVLDHLEPDSP